MIDASLLGSDWRINPVVLRVEWWFDGKHFSSVNHEVDCKITVSLQQLLAASQTGNAIGFRQLLSTTSFDTLEPDGDRCELFCAQSIGECQFHVRSTNRSVRFWNFSRPYLVRSRYCYTVASVVVVVVCRL